MMEVDLQLEPTPHVGTARELFPIPAGVRFGTLYVRGYDVAPDGQRFYALLTPTPPPPPAVGHINLIQNRTEELKEKVPAVK